MKSYAFKIQDTDFPRFQFAVREKRDIIVLLMHAIKFMLVVGPVADGEEGNLRLVVSRMSRLFFVVPNKIFSIRFPFQVVEEEGRLSFHSHEIPDIDSKLTSLALGLVSSETFSTDDAYEFFEPLVEEEAVPERLWAFVRELIMFEDGYFRYEVDMERASGEVHPENHYDIFYTNGASLKLGSVENHTLRDVIDVVNRDTECFFLRRGGTEKSIGAKLISKISVRSKKIGRQ